MPLADSGTWIRWPLNSSFICRNMCFSEKVWKPFCVPWYLGGTEYPLGSSSVPLKLAGRFPLVPLKQLHPIVLISLEVSLLTIVVAITSYPVPSMPLRVSLTKRTVGMSSGLIIAFIRYSHRSHILQYALQFLMYLCVYLCTPYVC